jgi:uncharacterized membrane protein
MTFWTRIVVCATTAAGLATTAVPAAASPVPAAAPKGSCKLITVREAGRILGTPAGSGKSTVRTISGVENEDCEWKAKKKGTGGLKGQPLTLEIAVESGPGLVDTYQTEKVEDPLDTDEVTGLGDDAFIKDLDLHVLVGERVLSVELHNYRYPEPLTQQQIQQKEQDAAQIALGRLT